MRVTVRRRHRQDEQGAVAVIVFFILMALFGIAMLTIDLGGMLVKRREMVNTADAAALAAAQWCAESEGALAVSPSATTHANDIATANVPGAALTRFDFKPGSECPGPAGEVTVGYEAQQDLHFAPVLGLGETRAIHGEAVGLWGPASSAAPVPVMVASDHLTGDCGIPDGKVGTRCAFWYDVQDLGTSQWGFLDLSAWDVPAATKCPNVGAGPRSDWINEGFPEPLPLNYPSTTYVCTTSGLAESVWQTLSGRVGDILAFPVNDPSTMLMGANGDPDKYNIVGFTSLKLIGIYRGDSEEATGTADQGGNCGKRVAPFTLLSLDSFGCYLTPPDVIENLSVSAIIRTDEPGGPGGPGKDKEKPPKPGPPTEVAMQPGVDYTYDPALRTIEWHRNEPTETLESIAISFTWSIAGTTGACEPPERELAALARAKCVVAEWRGFSTEGIEPNPGGVDFGVRAYRLSG